MSDLLTRDLIKRYNAGQVDLAPRLLACLLRERDEVSGGLMAVWFCHSWSMRRKKGFGRRRQTKMQMDGPRFPKDQYEKLKWSDYVVGPSDDVDETCYYSFPYKPGRTLAQYKLDAAWHCFQDEHLVERFDEATGIVIITSEMDSIIQSTKYSDRGASCRTLIGIAMAQAVETIPFQEPSITWWD